jgi:hypothetical protein
MQDQNDSTVPQDVPEPVDVPQEQPQVEEQAPSQEAPVQQEAETPQVQEQQPVAPAYDPADINTADYINREVPQVTPDDDGYIDPNAFRQSVVAEVRAEMEFSKQEDKAWKAIEGKYPEIASDPELKDLVNAQRIADVAQGGAGNLGKIADKVVGKMKSYQQQGKAQAQVSETVQKSAGLQKATANKVDSSKDSDLIERMSRGDETAQHELISEWLTQGKL